MQTQHALVKKHAKPLPRYTSYPTAPHFHQGIDSETYQEWLRSIDAGDTLSLYFHIPYCDTLCWFCGCNTKHTKRYQPVAGYLPILKSEMTTVAGHVTAEAVVRAIHWGGGSPTILTPQDICELTARIRTEFTVHDDAEFSVEIDPRGMAGDKIEALANAGVTRASIGVQDFDDRVQKAINREQSFEETDDVISGLRAAGISKINIDLIYGLPWQTQDSVRQTVSQVLALAPDRIALFGYAHVPWMKPHQTLIDEAALPSATERFDQSQLMGQLLVEAGFEAIGMDHFALPDDPLAVAARTGRLRRNFQGYTDDPADVLLGFGASAIGKLKQGYVQNVTPSGQYQREIADHGLAVASGYALNSEDHLRAHVIERLICDFALSCSGVEREFGATARKVFEIADNCARNDCDGLVEWDQETLRITAKGRPFVRNICAQFDDFLPTGKARHSLSV